MGWIKKLDFEKSIKEIQQDEKQGKDLCLDPLRFEDLSIKSAREKLIETAEQKIKAGNFIKPLIEIDIPKANYILRPGARPNILGWVMYQAIVNFIGKSIYKLIPDYSYSFNKFREQFKRGKKKRKIDHWLDFENKISEYAKRYKYMLTTDIASFFENISLGVLKQRLLILKSSGDYSSTVNYLIENILKPWTVDKVENFGLPQGPWASSILADIYLYSIDREMKKRKIKFIRYMDDIRIFTKNKHNLKIALKYLVKSLRNLKLNLNAKKTDIYDTEDKKSLKKVIDPEKGRLNLIDNAFKSKKSDQIKLVISSLFELLELSKDSKNTFRKRYFKFFVSHVIHLMKFGLVDKKTVFELSANFIDLFEDKPHLTDIICWFLLSACCYDKSLNGAVKNRLLKFIRDISKNIYEWQEMWILDTLRQLNNLTSKDLKLLKKVINNHELCQGQLALILGRGGNPDDREELLNKVRTGIMRNDQIRYFSSAIQEMHEDIRKQILKKIPEYFKEYLRKLSRPKYGFIYFLSKTDLDIEYYSEY